MNMKMIKSLCIFLIVALYISCTESQHSGTSTETTNGIQGVAYLSNNEPAINASVKLFDSEQGIWTQEAKTDSNGKFQIDMVDSNSHLFIENNDQTQSSWTFYSSQWDELTDYFLTPPVDVYVKYATTSPLHLKSTPFHSVSSDSQLHYFKQVPFGRYIIADESKNILGSLYLDSLASDTIELAPTIINGRLLDDFNDKDEYPLSPWITENWTITPSFIFSDHFQLDDENNVYYELNQGISNDAPILKLKLNSEDFTELDSLQIQVRGNGNLLVTFIQDENNQVREITYGCSSTDSWSQCIIRLNGPMVQAYSTHNWIQLRTSIDEIRIFSEFPYQSLGVDNIYYFGLEPL